MYRIALAIIGSAVSILVLANLYQGHYALACTDLIIAILIIIYLLKTND